MAIKAIITGSTGMIGKGVLLECLESPEVSTVLAVNRSPGGIKHEKLKEVFIGDFSDLSRIEAELAGYDACFFCLGTTAVGKTEELYHSITYELTLHFAEVVLRQNSQLIFCYLSAAGADSVEKSRMMWARVRGKTENALFAMPFKSVYVFRPGLILPMKSVKSKTKVYRAAYAVLRPCFPILTAFPKLATNTENFGKAMINAALRRSGQAILENGEINRLAKGS